MTKTWTYEAAGVPHLKGDAGYNRKIASLIRSTHVPGVIGSPTGFAAAFDLSKAGAPGGSPLLVSSTDGVGTKLEIARLQKRHDTIGIDLVAMCVNDIITCGARPLFFLDYFATGKFDAPTTWQVLKGIAAGCREAGCALVGGETAIMPGFYEGAPEAGFSQYDLAGFSVGLVDRKRLIDGSKVKAGDAVLGLASSGFHSNGYSLLRKLFSESDLKGKIGQELLRPTRIYVKPVLALLAGTEVRAIANITGGGFVDNLPRVLPRGLGATISKGSWPLAKGFKLVRDFGNIADFELYRTFNMGIGMMVVLNRKEVRKAQAVLKRFKVSSWVVGEIIKGKGVEVR